MIDAVIEVYGMKDGYYGARLLDGETREVVDFFGVRIDSDLVRLKAWADAEVERAARADLVYVVEALVPWIQVAIFVLVDAERRMLMEWREDWPPSPGAWVFPGGKVEAGETVEQAAIREAREELGIQVLMLYPLGAVATTAPYVNLPFLVTEWNGELPKQTDAGDRLRWSLPLQTLESAWAPAREIAKRAIVMEEMVRWTIRSQ